MEAYEIEKCIDRFGTDIYRFCLKLSGNKQDAEDLYQQTFLKALESSLRADFEKNPRALFFTLAYHLWKSTARKNTRRAAIAPCRAIDEENENLLCSGENVENSYAQKELGLLVKQSVEALPDRIRAPMTLYYMSGLSVEQVAKLIKSPAGTVKSRLAKGRGMIKKRLEEAGYGI